MPSLKCRCQITSPHFPPSPPLLHSWSPLFDLFIFYVGEPDRTMVSFISEACVPTTSTLKSPRVPHLAGWSDVTWSWRTGSTLEWRKQQKKVVVSIGSHRQWVLYIRHYGDVYLEKHCQAEKTNSHGKKLWSVSPVLLALASVMLSF